MDGRRTSKSNHKYHCSVTIHFKFITKCDSLFYYKMRWSVITKYDSFFITKCYKCYNNKVRQVLQNATNLLQSATEHTHHQLFPDIDIHFNIKFSREMFLFIWIVRNSEIHNRATRHSNINLVCPKYKQKTEGVRTFTTSTIKDWNSMNANIRNNGSLASFKHYVFKFFLAEQKAAMLLRL